MSSNSSTSSFLRRLFLVGIIAFAAGALTGCNLYFDDSFEPGPRDDWPEDCWDCGGSAPDAGPLPGFECTEDFECAPGCYCSEINWCEESGFCDQWTPCSNGWECDDRGTCVLPEPEPEPEPEPTQTCQGEVECAVIPTICPIGTRPIIEFGCYTGGCMAMDDCPDGAPFECRDLNDSEEECIANIMCRPIYIGVNCTSPTGALCTSGSTDCSCESFELDRCRSYDP